MVEQWNSVEQCGGTLEQCGTLWNSIVEQYGGTVWNSKVEEWWNRVTEWKGVVEQCGTVW